MAHFHPSETFTGPREGHIFKQGPEGLGYYPDEPRSAAIEQEDPYVEMLSEPRPFAPGLRVVSEDGYFGTVRYVGPVKTSKKPVDFVGVEWDDPGRGKHDGSVAAKGSLQPSFSVILRCCVSHQGIGLKCIVSPHLDQFRRDPPP